MKSKKVKLATVIAFTAFLLLYWAALAVTHTKYHLVNYLWEAALSVEFIVFGAFGIVVAKKWSWLKSSMGSGLVLISFGLIAWALAQAGWTYYVIKDPNQQNPNYLSLNITYFLSIPLWFAGMFRLSKATGAKYGLRPTLAKVGVLFLILVMFALSYYLLVDVARGGTSYFHQTSFSNVFFDLGYAAGDAINLTLALAIFGLSWKYLGGMFKKPILLVLLAFASIYLADLLYSYFDGKSLYYNGQWDDLLYLATGAIFGAGIVLLEPVASKLPKASETVPTHPPQVPVMAPQTPEPLHNTDAATSQLATAHAKDGDA